MEGGKNEWEWIANFVCFTLECWNNFSIQASFLLGPVKYLRIKDVSLGQMFEYNLSRWMNLSMRASELMALSRTWCPPKKADSQPSSLIKYLPRSIVFLVYYEILNMVLWRLQFSWIFVGICCQMDEWESTWEQLKRVFANEPMIVIMSYGVYVFKDRNENKRKQNKTCRESSGICGSRALNKVEELFY